jgi:hypothetical protein
MQAAITLIVHAFFLFSQFVFQIEEADHGLGLTFAAGSAFTNGLPRLLPNTVHVPLILLFVPQLSSLVLLIFWMICVRFTGWYKDLTPS